VGELVETSENWMSLRAFVAGLRAELRAAHEDAEAGAQPDSEPRFVVGPVNVEFTLAARKEADGKGGIKFYVFEFGAGGSVSKETTQRVSLTLTPLTKDGKAYDMSDTMSAIPK
jgi:hypothetical protein